MEIEKVIRVVILLVVVVQFGVSVAARVLTPNAEIHLPWVTLCLLPLLWPGTSKGTTRIRRKFSSASWMGARRWSSRVRFASPFIFTSVRGPLAK